MEAAVDQMRPGLPGMEIDTTIFRPATFVETAIDNLSRALLIGSLLVILILIVFLYDWRSAVITGSPTCALVRKALAGRSRST